MPAYETPKTDPDLAMEHTKIVAAIRCLERRFGQSTLPYEVKRVVPGHLFVMDRETGSWIKADISWHRVRVLEEFDGA